MLLKLIVGFLLCISLSSQANQAADAAFDTSLNSGATLADEAALVGASATAAGVTSCSCNGATSCSIACYFPTSARCIRDEENRCSCNCVRY